MGTDFNGDGRDDVLWRDRDNGTISNWLATLQGGFLINDANALFPATTSAHVLATGDFNGDGRDDMLLRNFDNGAIGTYHANGAGGFSFNNAWEVPIEWEVAGAGDFDGDGHDDILWRNTDGRLSNWLGNADGSFTINDANALTNVLAAWPVQGIGDFNGDGRDDVVTRHASGTLNLSLGWTGGGFEHEDPFGQVPADWQIAGVGDFDGDGNDDLLWRNSTTGAVSNWLYGGGLGSTTFAINDVNAYVVVSNNWRIVSVGDYDGDGSDDLLWRNSNTGALSNWLATSSGGWVINDDNALVSVPTNWLVQPNPTGAGEWDY
jgi:FG-GAP-like repeat